MKKIAIVAVTLILVIVAGMQELADSGSQIIIADMDIFPGRHCI